MKKNTAAAGIAMWWFKWLRQSDAIAGGDATDLGDAQIKHFGDYFRGQAFFKQTKRKSFLCHGFAFRKRLPFHASDFFFPAF